jgi:hypothetical protein
MNKVSAYNWSQTVRNLNLSAALPQALDPLPQGSSGEMAE